MPENSYWEQIEQYFVKKRGSALILSPKDWPLVNSWQERDIPLEVIYEGIDTAFARFEEKQSTARHQTIWSLAYCKYDVEEAWNAWKEHRPQPAEEYDARERFRGERQKFATNIRSTADQLQHYVTNPRYQGIHAELVAVSEILGSYIPLIEQAEDTTTLSEIQEDLWGVEQRLTASLEHSIDDETRRELYAKAEARLVSHKHKMDERVYQETLQLAFIQELHNAYPLPSLSD